MCINSFGAVVSDNDGSAFITKAEFDSLKNDFQSQIDQYNTSIDSKIDGAIASYLAGINIQSDIIYQPLLANYNEIAWMRRYQWYGDIATWSGTNNKTISTNVWYDPPADDRWASWNKRLDMSYTCYGLSHTGYFLSGLLADNDESERMSSNYQYFDYASRYAYPPVPYFRLQDLTEHVRLQENTSGYAITRLLREELPAGYQRNEGGYDVNDATKAWNWMNVAKAPNKNTTYTNTIENLGAEENKLVNLAVWFNRAMSRTDDNTGYQIIKPDVRGSVWPIFWITDGEPNKNIEEYYSCEYERRGGTGDLLPAAIVNYSGFHAWVRNSSYRNTINTFLPKIMLGASDDQIINVLRYDQGTQIMGRPSRITKYSKQWVLPWHINSYNVFTPNVPWTSTTDPATMGTGLDIEIQLTLPGWERVKLENIESGNYKVGNDYLCLGQGMPIIQNGLNSGTFEIKFKYSVKRMANTPGTNTSLKKIECDIRKNDFLTGNLNDVNTYYDIIVDDATTVTRGKSIALEKDSDKEVKLTIEDYNANDDIWIRFRPETTDGGYYVTISDLKIKETVNK